MKNKNVLTTATREAIFITPEKVIVNLLAADNKRYLTILRLYEFVEFIRKQLNDDGALKSGEPVVFDLNFESIERTVQYNNRVYDLIGDTIYFKGTLPDTNTSEEDVLFHYAQQFVAA
jgi:hypothetical protein